MQHDHDSTRINDIALHQIKRQPVDHDITFIGKRASTHATVEEDGRTLEPELVVWIARHSVVPDQPQPRAIALTDPDMGDAALVNALIEAILPAAESPLTPMMPGRIEVSDEPTVRMLRQALEGIDIEVTVADDMTLVDSLIATVAGDVRRQLTPMPPWDVPVQQARDLASAAANLYRRAPWDVLDDAPPIAVEVKRYGIDTLYLVFTYDPDDAPGVVGYLSLEDYHLTGKIGFLMSALEDADGEIINLDLPPEDIQLIESAIKEPETSVGEALTVFFVPTEDLAPNALEEIRKLKLQIASRQAAPVFTRISRQGTPRRPDSNETHALRLAYDAFTAFFIKHRERLESESWHFAPITATIQVKDGERKVPVKVSLTSPAATFDPRLHDAVLRLRVYMASDRSVWREIEVLGQQPLWQLDEAIQQSFGWPVRLSSFLPKDTEDGDETYESSLVEDTISVPKAPIGLLVQKPRDFCNYMYDVEEHGIWHRVRLVSVGEREPGVEYPRTVRSHGEVPPLDFEDDEDDDDFDEFEDDEEFEIDEDDEDDDDE